MPVSQMDVSKPQYCRNIMRVVSALILFELFLMVLEGSHACAGERSAHGNSRYRQDDQNVMSKANGVAMVSSGTGFFISNRGYIISNEHVVRGCDEVMIRGAVDETMAKVIATDATNDLALILAENIRPPKIASIRDSGARVRVGDPVMLIGYPKEHGMTGQYRVNEATVLNLHGPMAEPRWIQFSDSAEQGNSGGPLLDASGNVIGVIAGKASLTEYDRRSGEETVIQKSDVAISLPVLEQFLGDNGVYYRSRDSSAYFDTSRVESQARNYVVNIHCNRMQALIKKVQERKRQRYGH